MGDPFERVGRATLHVDDVVNFLRGYDDRPFDLTVTSPPYNLGKEYEGLSDSLALAEYLEWTSLWSEHLLNRTSPHGRLALNIPLDTFKLGHVPFASEITQTMIAAGWSYQTTIVWDKGVINSRTAYGSWMAASAPNIVMPVELVVIFSKDSWKREKCGRVSDIAKAEFMEWRSGVWRFPGESSKRRDQPAPFPEELPRRLIKLLSFTDDLIFDPFVGSGTTCVAAEALGRASVGVDAVERYIHELAVPRIRAVSDRAQGVLVDLKGDRWVNCPLLVIEPDPGPVVVAV